MRFFPDDIKVLTITEKALKDAEERAKKFGEGGMNQHSFSPTERAKYEDRLNGFTGEEMFHFYLEGYQIPFEKIDNYSTDVKFYNRRVDVKTKRRNVRPQMKYEGSIPAHQRDKYGNKADYYYFVQLYDQKAYFIGMISSGLFYENAKFRRRGDRAEGGLGRFREDTYQITYADVYKNRIPLKGLEKVCRLENLVAELAED